MKTLLKSQSQKTVKNWLTNMLLTFLAMQISSCTHSRLVIRQQPDAWAHQVNATAEKKRGKVYFKTGDVALAQKISVSGDSLSWTERFSREKTSANLNEIKTITLIKKGKGAWEGFLAGLASGFAGGFMVGLLSGDDPPGWFSFTAEEKGLILGVPLGVLGGLTGLIVGKNSGSKDKYILSDEPADKPRVISIGKTARWPIPVRKEVP